MFVNCNNYVTCCSNFLGLASHFSIEILEMICINCIIPAIFKLEYFVRIMATAGCENERNN